MDKAISWWLQSLHNDQPGNPYDYVTVYGHHSDEPWDDPQGAKLIGNQLRSCNYVGLYLKFAAAPGQYGCTGETKHVITAWGDEQGAGTLSSNPAQLKVTDSDKSTGVTHAVETYTYDPYVDRWSFDYLPANHPYLVNIVTLGQAHENTCTGTEVVASHSITITNSGLADASALYYEVGVRDSTAICAYETSVTRMDNGELIADTAPELALVHRGSKHHYLILQWELAPGEASVGEELTITTRFTLPRQNTIYYEDVKFGYGDPPVFGAAIPGFEWTISTPGGSGPGGFVIGTFDLFADLVSATPVARNYLQHEYEADENPLLHHVFMSSVGTVTGYYIGNLQFGYSARELTESELLAFSDWRQYSNNRYLLPASGCLSTTLDGDEVEELVIGGLCIPAMGAWGLAITLAGIIAAGGVLARRRASGRTPPSN